METRDKVLEWRFTTLETLGAALSLASLAVGITLWSIATFQSRVEAIETKRELSMRIDSVEMQVQTVRTSMEGVAKDVSYIRGRLEPRSQKEE